MLPQDFISLNLAFFRKMVKQGAKDKNGIDGFDIFAKNKGDVENSRV